MWAPFGSRFNVFVVVGLVDLRRMGRFRLLFQPVFSGCLRCLTLFLQNTELVEDLLSKNCPDVMDHLRMVHLELIVLTPRRADCQRGAVLQTAEPNTPRTCLFRSNVRKK